MLHKKISYLALTILGSGLIFLGSTPVLADCGADHGKMEKHHMQDSGIQDMLTSGGQIAYSMENLQAAQESGERFLVAIHKDGCPVCAKQKAVLGKIQMDPAYKNLKVLIVNFDTDTQAVKKYRAGMSSLLLFDGKKELARASGLTMKSDILSLLKKKTRTFNNQG